MHSRICFAAHRDNQSQQGGITIPECFGKGQHRAPSHVPSAKPCAAGNFKVDAGNAGIKQILKICISPSTCAKKPYRKQIMPLRNGAAGHCELQHYQWWLWFYFFLKPFKYLYQITQEGILSLLIKFQNETLRKAPGYRHFTARKKTRSAVQTLEVSLGH